MLQPSEDLPMPDFSPAIPDLSVVIVNWNTCALLRDCLISLVGASSSLSIEMIVIDNASTDGSVEMIRNEFREVQLIKSSENTGFAQANNQGLHIARGRYCLLLNSDTLVDPDSLRKMVAFMDEEPLVGACGPQLRNLDGSLQPSGRRFPTLASALADLFPLPKSWRNRLKGPMEDRDYNQACEVDEISGAALIARRQALEEVGGLDQDFFFFGEDIDLCWRLKKAGWRVFYLPGALVTHIWGASRIKKDASHISLLAQRSYYLLFQKHRSSVEAFFLKIVIYCLTLAKLVKSLFQSLFSPDSLHAGQSIQLHLSELKWLREH